MYKFCCAFVTAAPSKRKSTGIRRDAGTIESVYAFFFALTPMNTITATMRTTAAGRAM